MQVLEQDVRKEVEELHAFFVDWFTGNAAPQDLDRIFVPRFSDEMLFISPGGAMSTGKELVQMFRDGYGANPAFRIAITDVKIQREIGDCLLVTYVEWQKGGDVSGTAGNSRITTALFSKQQPFQWLHVHETMMPPEEGTTSPLDAE